MSVLGCTVSKDKQEFRAATNLHSSINVARPYLKVLCMLPALSFAMMIFLHLLLFFKMGVRNTFLLGGLTGVWCCPISFEFMSF